MSKNIKFEFGRLLRQSRDAKGMSRVSLARRLGISPKTIQSWEMGRTFI
ncbi:MAG: helix-turn-helix domain-containing protein, partial [Planctomycetota bacterium]|nr:helix-turn-helix domain-containing protein [Planctomycetota bacterium]